MMPKNFMLFHVPKTIELILGYFIHHNLLDIFCRAFLKQSSEYDYLICVIKSYGLG